MGLFHKFSDAVKTFGVLDGCLYTIDRVLASLGGRVRLFSYLLVAQPVPAEEGKPLSAYGITVREAGPDDPDLNNFPLDQQVLDFRFGQGATCLIVHRKEKLLGCFWLQREMFEEDEVRCFFRLLPADRTVWDFDVYLMPEHRLGRGFQQLWNAGFSYMRERGATWSLSRIATGNARSVASHKAMGAIPVGRAIYLKGKRWQLTVSSVRPWLHMSFSPSQRPILHVRAPEGVQK